MGLDIEKAMEQSNISTVQNSKVPDLCKAEPCILGIDEAGRGPVLGPMVYGCTYCPIKKKSELADLGFADSKTLTEEKREELFAELDSKSEFIGWAVHILSPQHISNCMLRRTKYSLNALSHDTAIGLIRRAIEDGANIQEVFVDTVGDPTKYENLLKSHFPKLDICVSKKADALYPIVSAASICAKVARDRALRLYRCESSLDVDAERYGSGYPGDEKTKKFLTDHIDPVFGFPHVVRFSWSTAATILQKRAASVTWEDDDEDDKKKDNTPSVLSYFQKNTSSAPARKRHRFFTERGLELASDLF